LYYIFAVDISKKRKDNGTKKLGPAHIIILQEDLRPA